MANILTWLSRRRFPYEPLITVEISKSRLLANLKAFQDIAPHHHVAPVLKSNAYGHGLVEVADILEKYNFERGKDRGKRIPFIVVDSYFEAVALRAHGIRTHILIIGYTRPETIKSSRGQNTAFTVTSLEMLKEISEIRYAPWDWETGNGAVTSYLPRPRRAHRIHLKIDTGMHRQGISPNELDEAISIIQKSPTIILEGICSHLSDADNTDDTFTDSQIHIWNKTVKKLNGVFPELKFFHLSNTDGHKYANEISANVSRVGIGLYGISANKDLGINSHTEPVLSMKSIITSVKKIERGSFVGYANTFQAKKEMTIATIPVGYFEGLDRRLSGKGVITLGNGIVSCPIIGRISMNISSIDVSDMSGIKNGDEVIVISNNRDAKNSIVNIAKDCETIPYDIAVKIPAHLKRVVID